ncbi:MAG: orotidine-5'-phosphate decarboxylase [Actinomycetota bacterium]
MNNPLIVALDVPTLEEATALADRVGDAAGGVKVGMELFYSEGPLVVTAFDAPVFLDLKLHDIPTTVARAMQALEPIAPWMVNVHALGGRAMMHAAAEAKPSSTKLLAVTILTSLSDEDLSELGLPPAQEAVPALTKLAAESGCDGVVCAPLDVERVRAVVPPDFLVVTPGVRPAGSDDDEHARSLTPAGAIRAGATHLVVGRPVTRATDPRVAALAILEEISG